MFVLPPESCLLTVAYVDQQQHKREKLTHWIKLTL